MPSPKRRFSPDCGWPVCPRNEEHRMSEPSGAAPASPETLARLWEEHMRYEFETCNADDTIATMVDDAYVNHIPVMTGGTGKPELREFYATHFIPRMPPDMAMTPLSRTIGHDQLVEEMVVNFP